MIDTERHRDLTEREQKLIDAWLEIVYEYPYVSAEEIGEAWKVVLDEVGRVD